MQLEVSIFSELGAPESQMYLILLFASNVHPTPFHIWGSYEK